MPSSWAWGSAGSSLSSKQVVSPEGKRQKQQAGPYSVVHTKGTPDVGASKVGGFGKMGDGPGA